MFLSAKAECQQQDIFMCENEASKHWLLVQKRSIIKAARHLPTGKLEAWNHPYLFRQPHLQKFP